MDPIGNDSDVVHPGEWGGRLKERIRELEAELEDRTLELRSARALLRAQRPGEQAAADPGEAPPAELVHAIRSSSRRRHQPVWVTVDGEEMLVLVDGAGRAPDPHREALVWHRIRRLRESA